MEEPAEASAEVNTFCGVGAVPVELVDAEPLDDEELPNSKPRGLFLAPSPVSGMLKMALPGSSGETPCVLGAKILPRHLKLLQPSSEKSPDFSSSSLLNPLS